MRDTHTHTHLRTMFKCVASHDQFHSVYNLHLLPVCRRFRPVWRTSIRCQRKPPGWMGTVLRCLLIVPFRPIYIYERMTNRDGFHPVSRMPNGPDPASFTVRLTHHHPPDFGIATGCGSRFATLAVLESVQNVEHHPSDFGIAVGCGSRLVVRVVLESLEDVDHNHCDF